MKQPDRLVVLVTGVSSGIGRSIAETLAAHGHAVYGTIRSSSAHQPIQGVTLVEADVLDERSIHEAVRVVLEKERRIDALVNNAGVALVGAIEETTVAQARELFDTNLFGMARMTRAVLPIMREHGYGRIVNIGSVAGFLPTPFMGYYSASKHAVEGYTESLDHEVRLQGIRAMVVEPGFVRTRIGENSRKAADTIAAYESMRVRIGKAIGHQIKSGMDPNEVAQVVLRALQDPRPRNRYAAGRSAASLKRLRRFMPAGVFDQGLRRQLRLES